MRHHLLSLAALFCLSVPAAAQSLGSPVVQSITIGGNSGAKVLGVGTGPGMVAPGPALAAETATARANEQAATNLAQQAAAASQQASSDAAAAKAAATGALPAAGGTMTGPLTLNPANGLNFATIQKQVLTGTATGGVTGSYFGVTDNVNAPGQSFVIPWDYDHAMGGPQSGGNRETMQIFTHWNAPDNGVTTNPNLVLFAPSFSVNAGDNGTSLNFSNGARGAFFVSNPVIIATNATNLQEVANTEFDIACDASCSTAYKEAVSIVELGNDKTQGAQVDTLLALSASTGAVGMKDVIQIGAMNGANPFNAASTILAVSGTGIAKNGIDLSDTGIVGQGVQYAGCAFKFNTFCVDNNSNLTVKAMTEVGSASPASNGACTAGQHAWDNFYEYRCVTANTWKRAALTGGY